MTKKSSTPAIRFKGFTDTWEQRKLGDVAKYRNGKAHENDISEQGKFIVVNSKFVSTNGEVRKFSNKQIEPLFKNEIAFVLSDVPNGRAIARTFLVDKNDKYTLNQRIAGITPIEGTCPYFLHILMNRNKYFLQFDDGAKQTNLSVDDVIEFAEYYPSSEEQQQIGNFFRQLDNLITLHQRKYEKLHNIKKSMLEKMFPKNGSNVPEIRFKGFTEAWEQRKLGDIADIVGGGTPSTGNQSYWDGDIDWYAPAEIADQIYANSSQKKITGLGYENSSAKMLPPGTVLFTSRAGIGKTAILTRKGCTNQGFQSIVPHRGELDSYFIFSRTEELKRYGELVGAGSTFVEVSGKQMAVMELMMPPTMREQQTIGGFFQQLDHLITLHQRELEKLQNIKKSMLEKMFV